MTISGLLNHTGLAAVAFSIGIYLRYPLLFLLLVNLDLKVTDYQRALRLFLTIALLLTVEAIVGYAVLGKSRDRTFFTGGTSFGTTPAGFFFVYGSCFVVAHALRTRARWPHLAFMVLALAASSIGVIRSVFVLVPMLFLLLYATSRRLLGSRRLQFLAVGLLGLLIFAIFMPWHRLLSGVRELQFFSPAYRLGTVREILQILSSSDRLLLGFGPRSYSPGFIGQAGEMVALLAETYGWHSVSAKGMSQLVNAFSELGALGFGVYCLMLFAILRMSLRFRRNSLRSRACP